LWYVTDIQELSAIISTARAMAGQPKGLKVLMVDYLQLVKVPRRDIREQEVAEVSRALRLLALETGMLVLALIQAKLERHRPRIRRDLDGRHGHLEYQLSKHRW